jgi:nitroimidazol reductase NimA-like FMN-containing flavoprotein (pyridoxamine 5'-phosphate oxidase superfamily)
MKEHAIAILFILWLVLCQTVSAQQAPGSEKIAPPIDAATAAVPPDHPEFQKGQTCSECHDVTYDARATATDLTLRNAKMLEKDAIWQKIVQFLPGRERFAIATSLNSIPVVTTADFVLDPEGKAMYAVSEKGTQKLMHVRINPRVCLVRFEGWELAKGGRQYWISIQIHGNAEVVPSSDPRFEGFLNTYKLARMTSERATKRFDLLKVNIDRAVYFSSDLAKEGLSSYQVWEP